MTLKSKVGLTAAKAAVLRVYLNINGCSIVVLPARPSRSSRASLIRPRLALVLSHVYRAWWSELEHTGRRARAGRGYWYPIVHVLLLFPPRAQLLYLTVASTSKF